MFAMSVDELGRHCGMKVLIASCLVVLAWNAADTLAQEPIEPPRASVPSQAGSSYTPPPKLPSALESRLFGSPAPATSAAYGLSEVLSIASQNNPTLRQAQLHISAETAKALQAGLYPNPTLSYVGEQIFVDTEDDKDSPGEFQGGELEQRFVTAGKLRLSRQKYMQRAHVAEHQAMAQQFRVCNDVRIHFYRALAAQYVVELRRELLKTAEDVAVTAQESYNMGQARRPEVRRANVRLQQARLEAMTAENRCRQMLRKLSAMVGVDLATGRIEGELESGCPQLTFEDALYRILGESPEVAAARAKLAVDRLTLARENVEWVPDVVVRGGAGYNFEANETVASAGVSVEAPIYDYNQGTIRQAQADLARQRREIERVELDLKSRLADVYQPYLTAMQHAEQYQEYILPELKAAYAELLESYEENRVDWPEVLDAQQEYFDARLAQVDNLLEARTQEVLIYGYLLHDGLMAATGVVPPGHIDAVPKPR